MADPVTIGATLVTGFANLFGNASVARQREEALTRYRRKLIDAKYDPVEKAREIDRVGDYYNTEIANAQNSSAFGLGRYLNSNTAKAVSLSRMLGERSGAVANRATAIDEYNKKIDLQLAESELSQPITDPLGDLIEGGAAGLQLGMSIGNYQSELEFTKALKDTFLNRYGKKNPPVNPYNPGRSLGRFR